jgi:hypothetical protein
VDTDSGITLALRAKNRETASTTNVNGVYSEPVGYQAPNNNRARWNWEFSIDSGDVNLDAYDYYIVVDQDPSVGISNTVVSGLFPDNSYGNDTTLNGQGVEAGGLANAGLYNISQNSQNIVFSGGNPTLNATYDYELYAVEKGAGPDGDKLASVSITVVVGSGGSTVPQLIAALPVEGENHGQYVNRAKDLAEYLYEGGMINKKQKQQIITDAAKSDIGKK